MGPDLASKTAHCYYPRSRHIMPKRKRVMMQVMDELRKRQKAITGDFKARSQKAEKILGEIEECENTISALNESLSAVLLMDVMQAAVAAKAPKAKAAKVKSAKVKAVEI